MARFIHHDRMVRLFQRAIFGGAIRTSISTAEWNIAGDCLRPYQTDVIGRPRDGGATDPFRQSKWHTSVGKAMTMRVTIGTRCRKCEKCHKARSNEWRYRAREELRVAGRSWFGTLTLAPIAHYRMMSEARATAAKAGEAWNTLSQDERFKRVAHASLKEVTKYLKRVRKQSKVPLRYICVTEQHKSGLPHFHLLMHEVELKPVTHRILSTQWDLGFEKWKLIPHDDLKGAGYVTKYLAKNVAWVRIRASQHYGKPTATVGSLLAINRNGL